MTTTSLVTPAQRLRDQLHGRSDADIVRAFSAKGGLDAALDESFAGMAQAFIASRAGAQSAIIQYDIVTPEGLTTYQLEVSDGRCVARRGAHARPRVTLRLTFPDFLRVISGQLTGARAFTFGRLKITGDLFFSQVMQGWFNRAP